MYNPAELDKTPGIRIVPVACWVLGVVFGFVSQKLKWQFTTIAALDTIVFAGIVYFIAMLATKNKIKPSV
jgi:hypothetical protein